MIFSVSNQIKIPFQFPETLSAISTEKLGKVFIPVPSLEEQKVIADVLDSIDCLVSDLSVGLPGEITARRKQYEYFRGKLLTFKKLDVA